MQEKKQSKEPLKAHNVVGFCVFVGVWKGEIPPSQAAIIPMTFAFLKIKQEVFFFLSTECSNALSDVTLHPRDEIWT